MGGGAIVTGRQQSWLRIARLDQTRLRRHSIDATPV